MRSDRTQQHTQRACQVRRSCSYFRCVLLTISLSLYLYLYRLSSISISLSHYFYLTQPRSVLAALSLVSLTLFSSSLCPIGIIQPLSLSLSSSHCEVRRSSSHFRCLLCYPVLLVICLLSVVSCPWPVSLCYWLCFFDCRSLSLIVSLAQH